MQFEKTVRFLGDNVLEMRDGTKLHQVELFAEGEGSVKVNVSGSNTDVLTALNGLTFGQTVHCVFALRPADKLYRLALVGAFADKPGK